MRGQARRVVDPVRPLGKVGLAGACVVAGDKTRVYQDFPAVWKDTDPDVPVLRAVKAEYGKLQ